jgi:hypothetical protein
LSRVLSSVTSATRAETCEPNMALILSYLTR